VDKGVGHAPLRSPAQTERRKEVEAGAGGGLGQVEAEEGVGEGDGEARHDALVDCQVQRYYALMVRDYNAPRLDSVPPMAPTQAAGACEEINGCSRRMMMHRSHDDARPTVSRGSVCRPRVQRDDGHARRA